MSPWLQMRKILKLILGKRRISYNLRMILRDHMVSNTELGGGGDSVVPNRVQKKKKKQELDCRGF